MTLPAPVRPLLATLGLAALPALGACQTMSPVPEDPRWLVYPGGEGPGAGRRVVLVAGDEEYRSEEALPLLARQLSTHLGFECVVLFSQDPETGEIDPDESTHIPGLELVDDADLLVLQLRFRHLADEDMQHIVDYVEAGRPLVGIRTSTHAFNYPGDSESPHKGWTWTSQDPAGGFGGLVLGETWVAHHGHHGHEATRGIPNAELAGHPVLRGVQDVFGPTDVYAIRALPEDAQVLLWGGVVAGMDPADPLVDGPKNDPMHPVAWLRSRPVATPAGAVTQRVFATTMGTAQDWSSEDLRRLFLNASLWCLGEEAAIPAAGATATMTGRWEPTPFGFGGGREGFLPADQRDGTPPHEAADAAPAE